MISVSFIYSGSSPSWSANPQLRLRIFSLWAFTKVFSYALIFTPASPNVNAPSKGLYETFVTL